MPNNCKVNSVSVSSNGTRSASVSPPNPNPPPSHLAATVYENLTADQYAVFLAAFAADAKVDTTEGPENPPNCTGVTAHR